jgi:hypothetical protein
MAISVDWPTKVITVNQSDPEVSLVSGTTYELDTDAFRLALKALSDDEEGMPWPRITKHNTVVVLDGVNYVRSWEIINGYTVQVLPDSSWRLQMDGESNNNFHSNGILVQNSVQVIPANSAGNTITETGVSGLTAQESADLTAAVTAAVLARKALYNRMHTDPVTGKITVYDDDDVAKVAEGDLWEDVDGTQAYRGDGADRRDKLA